MAEQARGRAEEQAQRYAQQIRLLLDSTRGGICGVDLEGRCIFINRTGAAILGYRPEEVVGQPLHELIHHTRPDGTPYPEEACPITRCLQGWAGSRVDDELFWRKDGTSFPVGYSCAPVLDEGTVHGAVVTFADITEPKRMQDELRLAKAQAEQAAKTKACLLAAAPACFIGIDAEGVIFEWSPAAERIFGISIVDALGVRFRSLPIPWNWEAIEQAISRCRETLCRVTLEAVAVPRPDQPDALLRLILTPLLDDQMLSLVIMGEDVTERRRLERDLAQAQKLEAIGQLAAGIAHELNTPIQYVGDNVRFFREAWADLSPLFDTLAGQAAHAQGATSPAQLAAALDELCRRVDLDYVRDEIPKALAQSLEGLERVATIVRAMRNFAHPDTGEKVLTDLNQAIESTAVVSRNEWKYVAELLMDLDRDLPPVPCLPGEFNQAVLNLIVNAAHAIADSVGTNGKKGTIRITSRQVGEWAEIRVSDTGTGIPEAIRERIFEPFFTTKPPGKVKSFFSCKSGHGVDHSGCPLHAT